MTLFAAILISAQVAAQQSTPIADSQIEALESQLTAAMELTSSVRQKLALRRVAGAAESLIEQNQSASNRYEVMGVLFRTQKSLFKLDGRSSNRRAILETCEKLVEAPDEYAEIRVDADLLLSQAQVVRQGGDAKQRSEALRKLVERYLGTSVESKVVRTVLLMAVEAGEPRLIDYLDVLISERFASDPAMIAYKREKLPGRVFGATLFAKLRDTKGNEIRFPMDCFGTTTALLFWSNDENGQANLKEIAEVLSRKPPLSDRRIEILSVNLDELPDAGESILRQHGLDWTALHLPGGRDSLIYQAYARVDPKFVTVSPTGIASLFQTGGNMHGKGFERWIGSSSARAWVDPYYCSKLQSLASGEFLIIDPASNFDPAAPPELKVISPSGSTNLPQAKQTDESVPEATLRKIQSCFIAPPTRYSTTYEQAIAGYQQALELCDQAIKASPDAPNLWIVRNRRMVALMGLWKLKLDNRFLEQAATEAQEMMDGNLPTGTEAIARLCLARKAYQASEIDSNETSSESVIGNDGSPPSAPELAAAALHAMEIGDREVYAEIRERLLEKHGDKPLLWPLTAFMLDRYHQYWLYQIPFVSGRIYDRREARGVSGFAAESSVRTFGMPLKTLDGEISKFQENSSGKWIVLRLIHADQIIRLSDKSDPVVAARPFKDVEVYEVVLDNDIEAIKEELSKRKTPPYYDVLCVDQAVRESIDRKFSMLHDERRPSLVILRPNGSVALVASMLTYRGMGRHGSILSKFFMQIDESAVDESLSKGSLEQAQRIAFANAPVTDSLNPDKKLANEHLRARAKVHVAMGNWKAARADVELVYDRLLESAGLLAMRTSELDEIEQLRDRILEELVRDEKTP